MRTYLAIFRVALAAAFLLLSAINSTAQSIQLVDAIVDDPPENLKWKINITFVPVPPQSKIKRIFILDVDDGRIIELRNLGPNPDAPDVYTGTPTEPLKTIKQPPPVDFQFTKHYTLIAAVENQTGDKILSLDAPLDIIHPNLQVDKRGKVEANDEDDADIYLSGEINGARKERATFTTEVKLQKYKPVSASWRYTPYFKLNASTDPGADPDKMEMGLRLRYILGQFAGLRGAYYDHDIKLESERDFGNTNLIYDTRFTFLTSGTPKGLSNHKLFFYPYVGAELGKNLHSPLKAAEGDGIARVLAGADLRFFVFLKDGATPDINWTTSYTRRWLLTDELGFKTDENGDLQLRTFGKSPRDHVVSKFSYKLTNFLDLFAAYEWGQVPPSYKLMDHRFRLGFAYKFKFGVE